MNLVETKRQIMSLLDTEGITDRTLDLLVNYLECKGVDFETKMEAWKIKRADRFSWENPLLTFSLIRHPGGLRRQTWLYGFDDDEAVLYSEGPIPQSKPYKADKDARKIVEAITKNVPHPCIAIKHDKIIVNPRKISELVNAPKQTVEGRVKRLKSRIRELMISHPQYEETKYRNMLAYKKGMYYIER